MPPRRQRRQHPVLQVSTKTSDACIGNPGGCAQNCSRQNDRRDIEGISNNDPRGYDFFGSVLVSGNGVQSVVEA